MEECIVKLAFLDGWQYFVGIDRSGLLRFLWVVVKVMAPFWVS